MPATEHFDLLVVGGGKGGKTLAIELARAGWSVAMVERSPEMIGGTCINLACIPTKTVIRSAEVAETVRRASSFGVPASLSRLDAGALRDRKETVVGAMRRLNREQFLASGMQLVMGRARFVAPRRVEVSSSDGTRLLEGEHVVIDLGTRPAIPAIDGLAGATPLTSETLLELERIPRRLLVLGGSYVAVELAQAMHRFGSRVTVIERGSQLLPREDDDVAAAVAEILVEDGIEVVMRAQAERVEQAQLEDAQGLGARRRRLERGEEGDEQLEDRGLRLARRNQLARKLARVAAVRHLGDVAHERGKTARAVEALERRQVDVGLVDEHRLAHAEEAERRAEALDALARAARQRRQLAVIAREQRDDAIGLAVVDGAQHDRGCCDAHRAEAYPIS